MHNFFKLCSYELTKTRKRTSTKIMTTLFILSLLLSIGLAFFNKEMYNSYNHIILTISIIILTIMIIIAVSSISSEISNGTIETLICTPNKKWKILVSKLISYSLILFISIILITLTKFFIETIILSGENIGQYTIIINGSTHNINYIFYEFISNLINGFKIFIVLLISMLFSIITKRTSISICLGIMAYIALEIATYCKLFILHI